MRFAFFPVGAFARFAHGSSLMKTVTKCDQKNIIYEACDCFLGVFYFMRQSWQDSRIHRRDRVPVLGYECTKGHFYNLLTKTVWQGTHHKCSVIIRILQGIAQGVSTLHLPQAFA